MALRDHFETSGNWLFARRGYLPVVLFAVLLYGLRGFRYVNGSHYEQAMYELACFTLAALGQAVRGYAIGYIAPFTSGNKMSLQAESLNTRGLYSVVRHPLYLGSFLMWISIGLLTRDVWVVTVIALAFWLYYERIMFAEEAFLRGRFGEAYDEWAKVTPAFIPSFGLWQSPDGKFDLRRVLRRERSGFLGLVATYALFDAYVDFRNHGGLPDAEWQVLLIVAVSIYVAVELDKFVRRSLTTRTPKN